MDAYWCRVTVSYDIAAKAIERIASQCDKTIVYEHNDDSTNIHIHFYLEGCKVSTDTIKNYFKREGISGGKTGSGWSFNKARDNGCIVYATKGRYDPRYVKGYTDDEVTAFKDKWEDKPSKKQSRLTFVVKESAKESKLRQWDLVQEIVKRSRECHTTREICEVIRKVVIIENHTVMGRYKLRDYYDTVKAILDEKEWSLNAAQFCSKDFF